MAKIRILELFGGIGACTKALQRNGVDVEIADYVEIDKYAVKSYNAIHGTNFEPQDITKWDKDIEADLIMHGSPCQDFSNAGKQAGGDKGSGTRSSLMYETLRIVEKLRPKYVIWENVKNLLSAKHRHNFDAYQEAMENLGYKNFYQVLNAKDFGVPQNRERVFTVSIREDIPQGFEFPEPKPLKNKLKDILEPEVDEKYYLSDKALSSFRKNSSDQEKRGNGFRFAPTKGEKIAVALTTRCGGRMTDNFIEEPELHQIGTLEGIKGNDILKRVYDEDGLSPTLSTMQGGNQQPKVRIRSANSRGYDEAEDGDSMGVVEPSVLRYERTDYAKQIRKQYESGEIQARRSDLRQYAPRTDGMTNTITTVQKDNYVVEPRALNMSERVSDEALRAGLVEPTDAIEVSYSSARLAEIKEGRIRKQNSRNNQLCPTLRINADAMGYCVENEQQVNKYGMRIRKLTPKECWRLMGFDDEDFEKAATVNSNSQLYKQAGNSIVVNVLQAILKNLIKGE